MNSFSHHRKPGAIKTGAFPAETASAALGKLKPGFRVFGMTKGQFSLLDLLRVVVEQTGPADVVISTWTTGIRDTENVRLLMEKGAIRSLRLLTDRSFPSRQPEYCARVVEVFGEDAIRCTRTHAKFFLVGNDRWKVVCRSSMNLNRNPRFEQFDMDDDPELYSFLMQYVDEMEYNTPAGVTLTSKQCESAFRKALGGGLSDIYSLDDTDDDIGVGRVDLGDKITL